MEEGQYFFVHSLVLPMFNGNCREGALGKENTGAAPLRPVSWSLVPHRLPFTLHDEALVSLSTRPLINGLSE